LILEGIDPPKGNAQAARCTGEIAVKGFRGDLESVRCPISRCTGNEDVAPHYAKQENAVQIPLQNAVVWGGGVWYNAEHEKWVNPTLWRTARALANADRLAENSSLAQCMFLYKMMYN